MQVKKVPAALGWRWVVEGITTFFRLPSVMIATGALLLLTILLTTALPIPLLGPVIPVLLTPALSFGFAQVTRDVLAGRRPSPFVLFSGLGPKAVGIRKELLILGVFNVIATVIATVVSSLVDGGDWGEMMAGEQPADVAGEATIKALEAATLFLVIYAPLQAMMWFAPLFVGLHRIPAMRAIFYSVVSIWRNKWPLLAYSIGWIAVALLWSLAVQLLLPLVGRQAAQLLMFVAMILLLIVVYSSYWPTFRDIVESGSEDGTPVP